MSHSVPALPVRGNRTLTTFSRWRRLNAGIRKLIVHIGLNHRVVTKSRLSRACQAIGIVSVSRCISVWFIVRCTLIVWGCTPGCQPLPSREFRHFWSQAIIRYFSGNTLCFIRFVAVLGFSVTNMILQRRFWNGRFNCGRRTQWRTLKCLELCVRAVALERAWKNKRIWRCLRFPSGLQIRVYVIMTAGVILWLRCSFPREVIRMKIDIFIGRGIFSFFHFSSVVTHFLTGCCFSSCSRWNFLFSLIRRRRGHHWWGEINVRRRKWSTLRKRKIRR